MESISIIRIRNKAWQLLSLDHDSFLAPTSGEIILTNLAEATAQSLGHDEWLDDSDHAVWFVVAEVAEQFEQEWRKP
jgi:hypothetical protein